MLEADMQKDGASVPEIIKGYFSAYGRIGGQSRSKKKIEAARRNARRAALARKEKKQT